MLFLDTHTVIWLYQKELERFTAEGIELLESESLYVSPAVLLELEYLYEIERITECSGNIIDYLARKIGLETDAVSFLPLAERAKSMKWTRDPFDRLITAQAAFRDTNLLTKDRIIRQNYPKVIW